MDIPCKSPHIYAICDVQSVMSIGVLYCTYSPRSERVVVVLRRASSHKGGATKKRGRAPIRGEYFSLLLLPHYDQLRLSWLSPYLILQSLCPAEILRTKARLSVTVRSVEYTIHPTSSIAPYSSLRQRSPPDSRTKVGCVPPNRGSSGLRLVYSPPPFQLVLRERSDPG